MEKLFMFGVKCVRALGIPLSDALATRLHHVSRVGLVGLTCFILQSAIFEILGIRMGIVNASTAALIGGEIAVVTGFLLNNHFNFKGRSTDPFWRRLLIFHLVVSGSLFAQWSLVSLAEVYTSGTPMILRGAFLAGVAIGFVTNYIGYHLFVWRTH